MCVCSTHFEDRGVREREEEGDAEGLTEGEV